jgi:CheY-like chemotaxis protein
VRRCAPPAILGREDKVIAAPIRKSRAGLTGCRALNALAKDKFYIVLTDIHMPGLDGAEAFKRLRNSASVNRLTPVIALTAGSMDGDRGNSLPGALTDMFPGLSTSGLW